MTTTKILYWIRHGVAEHNELFKTIGERAYTSLIDTRLTSKGRMQSLELSKNIPDNIDLILVSPLSRTLETRRLIFDTQQIEANKVQTIVLDELIEHPQGVHICNKRNSRTYLNNLYPKYIMNFAEEIEWDGRLETYESLDKRIANIYDFIHTRSEKHIAIVCHNSYIKRALSITDEIEHCKIIEQVIIS
jgi:broad specificity phosphatase PhoE